MAGRGTNLALLALLAAAVATGALAFAIGARWVVWPTVVHGTVGLGLLLLAPWKSIIARRGLRRRRSGLSVSLVFTAVLAVALGAGVGHATGLLRTLGPITAMQVHVGAALAAIPFGVWHVMIRRIRPKRTDLSRRTFLRAGALAAGALAVYGAVSAVVYVAQLPGRRRRFTGSFDQGSFRPDEMPVIQWLNDRVPAVDASSWRLEIDTRHGEPVRLRLAELDSRREPRRETIDCTGGWYAEQLWEGVRLDRLLPPTTGSRSIRVESVTGYWRRYPVGDAAALWLATRVGGKPLSAGHGYPARLVAPGRRGFWWVKWVSRIELSPVPWWWQPPYPLT